MNSSSSSPSKSSSTKIEINNLKEQVNKKADEIWTKDMLNIHRERIDETKEIALNVKNKFYNRQCQQQETIREMRNALQSMKNIKFLASLSFLVIIGGGLFQFFSLKNTADNNQKAVITVQKSVKKIEVDVKDVTNAVESHIEEGKQADFKKEEDREELLKDISEVFKVEMKKSRRRN